MAEYVEREATLKEIERREKFMVGDKTITTDAVKSFIKNRPAADVAPVVHARWIKDDEKSALHVEAFYLCSACHNYEAWGETEKTPFCPNCGAKMTGGE